MVAKRIRPGKTDWMLAPGRVEEAFGLVQKSLRRLAVHTVLTEQLFGRRPFVIVAWGKRSAAPGHGCGQPVWLKAIFTADASVVSHDTGRGIEYGLRPKWHAHHVPTAMP
jgi:hypothetical protein